MSVADLNRGYELRSPITEATFSVDAADEEVAFTAPLAGNVVSIESDAYADPWVGRIIEREGEIKYDGDGIAGTVDVSCESYAAILDERFLTRDFRTPVGAPRAVAAIMANINAHNGTGIGVGYVENVATPVLTLPDETGISALDKLAEVGGLEWWLDVQSDRGELRLNVNMRRDRGGDHSHNADGLLEGPEGGNFQVDSWLENGRGFVYTQRVIGGQQSVTQLFSERERGDAVVGDRRQEDGVRQVRVALAPQLAFGYALFGSADVRSPVNRRERVAFRDELRESGVPADVAQRLQSHRRLSARSMIGRAYMRDDQWQFLSAGDVIPLRSRGAFLTGYNGVARVIAAQPMESEGFVDLVLEVQ